MVYYLAIGGKLTAIDGATNITYDNNQYAYDVTNNRACLKQTDDAGMIALLTKKNTDSTDKQKYSISVCKNE